MTNDSTKNSRRGPWVTKKDFVFSGSSKEYKRHFTKNDAHASPFEQLRQWVKKWIHHVEGHKSPPPKLAGTAGTLITMDEKGFPAARTIPIQKIAEDGIVFITKPGSPKMHHLKANEKATYHIACHYNDCSHQVEMKGTVEPCSDTGDLLDHRDPDDITPWIAMIFKPEVCKFSAVKHYEDSDLKRMSANNYVQYSKKGDAWDITELDDYTAKIRYIE